MPGPDDAGKHVKVDWDEVYSMICTGIGKIIYCVGVNRVSGYFWLYILKKLDSFRNMTDLGIIGYVQWSNIYL